MTGGVRTPVASGGAEEGRDSGASESPGTGVQASSGTGARRRSRAAAGAGQRDERARARDVVLRKLAAAPRSRVELERALAEKEVEAAVAAEVLDRYTELGLVDDQEYADLVVRSQQTARGLARRGLAHELRRRGVGDDVAARALDQVDDDAERAAARALVAKRLGATAGLDAAVRQRRLIGVLARKGYDAVTASAVVREALAAEGADTAAWDDEPAPDDD